MGRYRLHKPLCIPQFVFILMLYTMLYCTNWKINTYLLTYLLRVERKVETLALEENSPRVSFSYA